MTTLPATVTCLSSPYLTKTRKTPSRTDQVPLVAQEIAGNYFGKDYNNHTGRPDVIVLEIISEDADGHEYLIVEVKNSTNEDTIHRGIKETFEYLAFLQAEQVECLGA